MGNLTLSNQQLKLIEEVLERDLDCSRANIAAGENTLEERRRVEVGELILDQVERELKNWLPVAK